MKVNDQIYLIEGHISGNDKNYGKIIKIDCFKNPASIDSKDCFRGKEGCYVSNSAMV